MEKIKLIIWDLDETFWHGTLSDGEITPIERNINWIKKLTDNGIINSICSKNDYEKTKQRLVSLGIWDFFVFPSIDWSPKGNRINDIIKNMQLRACNCLFIDDNINNLEEAKYIVPDIQTVLAEKIPEIITDPALQGAPDEKHSRLNQYKILEKKAIARKDAGSNEDFLFQSDIHVDLIEKTNDKLERIYEMIHRNNQLNFTKDRISQEEVNSLFTNPKIKSGVIHVTDKFGDHGIVGCYAIDGNIVKQFVLSCRILGMGIEQWVYAKLGFPEIKVVGEVAAELNKVDCPAWINQNNTNNSDSLEASSLSDKKLYLYGTCPLRPIWAYLQPKFKNAVFAEIDPRPSVLNLSVNIRETIENKNFWLSNINLFDKEKTFDPFALEADFIFITLAFELEMFKYTDNENHYFYSKPLDTSTASTEILSYSKQKVTVDDIYNEITFLCKKIKKSSKILLLTVPEVVFPSLGENIDYKNRLEINAVTDRLYKENKNVELIDIREYAKFPSDFFDNSANHYNRIIGYSLANDVLKKIGFEQKNIKLPQNHVPANAIKQTILVENKNSINLCLYILNSQLSLTLSGKEVENYEIKYEIFRNRLKESTIEFSNKKSIKINIARAGKWWVRISFKSIQNKTVTIFGSKNIDYNFINYASFLDANCENYNEAISFLPTFIGDTNLAEYTYQRLVQQTVELASNGVNVTDFFTEKGISQLILFVDKKIAQLILPFFYNSSISIKKIYTVDYLFSLATHGEHKKILNFSVLDNMPKFDKTDIILFAYDYYQWSQIDHLFEKSPAKKFFLPDVLNKLMTKTFFVSKYRNLPQIFSVRLPSFNHNNFEFPYKYITPSEKTTGFLKDEIITKRELREHYEKIPSQLKKIPTNQLKETLTLPPILSKNGIPLFDESVGSFLNIKEGIRLTKNQPIKGEKGTIYLFGGTKCLGVGVPDDKTIASFLQKMIGSLYRVENYANFNAKFDYDKIIPLIDSIHFDHNDLIFILQDNWEVPNSPKRTSWLDWDALSSPIIKVDAWPIFMKMNRPDYFLIPNAFNEDGNKEIAKLLAETIEKYNNQ